MDVALESPFARLLLELGAQRSVPDEHLEQVGRRRLLDRLQQHLDPFDRSQNPQEKRDEPRRR